MSGSIIGVAVDAHGLTQVLDAYYERAANLSMSLVGEVLQEAVDMVLQSEGSRGSQGKWAPLSESYKVRRPERAAGQMLQDTGLLAATQVRLGDGFAEVYSPAEYAIFHALGTSKMPRRDFLAVDMEFVHDEVSAIIMEQITAGSP